jgi:glycosyltransferase involved in cell wall biosynthesis
VLPFADRPDAPFLHRAGAFGEHVLDVARRGDYDLWHVRSIWEGLPLALARRPGGPPLVFELNGLPSIELPSHFARLANEPALLGRLRRQELALMDAADAIVTVSPVQGRCLAELGVPAGKVHLVPNGVDLARFAPAAGEGTPEVLYIGTFAPWQGLVTLLRAFAAVPPPVRLRLVGPAGKGWAHALDRLAGDLGVRDRVLIQPPVPHALVPELIANARVCVAPLDGGDRNVLQGCCPLKLLEYMASGRAVVASKLPAIEAIATDDVEALLVPPDDPAALAAALRRVLSDPTLARRLGAAGRRRAETMGWDKAVCAVLDVYDRLGVTNAAPVRG